MSRKYAFAILIRIYILITIFCMVEDFTKNCIFEQFYVPVKNVEKRKQTILHTINPISVFNKSFLLDYKGMLLQR